MAIQVDTRDCAALNDADLDEMASMGGAFDIGVLSKAKEDWVLITSARIGGTLHGFAFATLERIGGTPCVLIGLLSVKRTSKRDTVLKGLMAEAYHRALMAFPEMVERYLRGEGAGYFARRGSADTVGDHEERGHRFNPENPSIVLAERFAGRQIAI